MSDKKQTYKLSVLTKVWQQVEVDLTEKQIERIKELMTGRPKLMQIDQVIREENEDPAWEHLIEYEETINVRDNNGHATADISLNSEYIYVNGTM